MSIEYAQAIEEMEERPIQCQFNREKMNYVYNPTDSCLCNKIQVASSYPVIHIQTNIGESALIFRSCDTGSKQRMTTKPDEVIVYVRKSPTKMKQAYNNGNYGSNIQINDYLVVTNYGNIFYGYFNSNQEVGQISNVSITPTHCSFNMWDTCQTTRHEVTLIPNTLPITPKVPKLFVDVLVSVMNRDQAKFQELCGEFIKTHEQYEILNDVFEETKEELEEKSVLLDQRLTPEDVTQIISPYEETLKTVEEQHTIEMQTLRDELTRQHAFEMEALRDELTRQHAFEMEALREELVQQHAHEMKVICKEHTLELQTLREEFATPLSTPVSDEFYFMF